MVNITARQWKLNSRVMPSLMSSLPRCTDKKSQILPLRFGRGAIVLPPPPAPQLTSVSLVYPRNRNVKPGKKTDGLAQIQRQYLPRLKYYNPSIKINVENPEDYQTTNCMITLQFEGTDPQALRALAQKSRKTPSTMKVGGAKDPETGAEGYSSTAPRPSADADEVVLKAQPAANPSSPSSVNPPAAVYTRSVTFAAANKPHWEVWRWFRKRTGGTGIIPAKDDLKLREDISKHKKQAEVDRGRVKLVTAQMKEEQAALQKAQKAVEQAETEAS